MHYVLSIYSNLNKLENVFGEDYSHPLIIKKNIQRVEWSFEVVYICSVPTEVKLKTHNKTTTNSTDT